MPFLDLERDIAEDFEEAAGEHREFFDREGFTVFRRGVLRPKRLPPCPPRAPGWRASDAEDARLRAALQAELVGTTWGREASLAAQRRRDAR